MLAGQQPQEPRWQPPEEPAADQPRPSWQPFAPAVDADAETYAFSLPASPPGYEPAPAQAAQVQAGQVQAGQTQAGQTQPRALERDHPPDQGYAMPGGEAYPPPPPPPPSGAFPSPPGGAFQPPQGYTPPGQAYEAYGVPGQPGLRTDPPPPPGYGDPQAGYGDWQASSPLSGMRQAGPGRSGRSAKPAKSSHPDSKGFLGSLFDFSFSALVTPRIIKVLYVLATIWTALWAIILIRYGFHFGGFAGGLFTLIVVVPIFILLMLGGFRVVLEVFVVLNRIHGDVRAMRGNSDGTGDGKDPFRP